ncbi:MAG: Gfo/Idh/MocA family oxidoreductase [Gaiellales bacterium]
MSRGGRYRVGVLGNCCTHGEFVVAALRSEPRAELVAGWQDERDPRRGPALARALDLELCTDARELIEDPAIDVVAICTDPSDKAGWVERAAAAGKHIFLNKPMCESLDSARQIEAAVERYGVQLVHDIVVIRFHPLTAKLLEDVHAGRFGEPLHHAHSWGMTFSIDFPLAGVWPERLDPPARSGGGELTNMGCYAIDYMVGLWGRPRTVQAKSSAPWDVYRDAGVESFGQIVADYGSFFAVLATGKQTLRSLPPMDVSEALSPRNWHNELQLQFADANVTLHPFGDLVLLDGRAVDPAGYLDGFTCSSPFEQLVGAIETGEPPASNAGEARLGVEVLTAAYQSVANGGEVVSLPLEDGRNPLLR